MITVEKVKKDSKESASFRSAASGVQTAAGRVKTLGQDIWPWLLGIGALGIFGWWFWKKGTQDNGEVPG